MKRRRTTDTLVNRDNDIATRRNGLRRDDDGDMILLGEEDEDIVQQHKRAMRIRSNLRFLQKIPSLATYQRAQNGRRGAIDGGALTDLAMIAALEESFEETSFVTLESPSPAALVAPISTPVSSESTLDPNRRVTVLRPTTANVSEKDDESRPPSQESV